MVDLYHKVDLCNQALYENEALVIVSVCVHACNQPVLLDLFGNKFVIMH